MEFWHLAVRAIIIGIVTGLGIFWIIQAWTRQEATIDQEWSREALESQGLSDQDIDDISLLARQAIVRKLAQREIEEKRIEKVNRRRAEKMSRNKVWID